MSYIKIPGYFITGLFVVLLSGCATRPPMHGEKIAYWQTHREKLTKLNTWQIKGRIAVQMEKQGWSATLQWRQRQQDYFLRIIAPLGGGIYELSGNEDGVLMRTAKNMTLRADNPETLLQNNFGWHVPLSGLVYWLRGLPEPGSKTNTLVLDDQGRITDLVQAGWQISYLRYITASGFDLPGKIVIQNDKLKVQLIIRDWKI